MKQVVERKLELAVPASTIWRALTRAPDLSTWFGAEVELEPRLGGRATFTWPDGTQRDASIEVFEPERHLLLRWLPFQRDPSGATRPTAPGSIRFVIEEAEHHAVLYVTESLAGQARTMSLSGSAREDAG